MDLFLSMRSVACIQFSGSSQPATKENAPFSHSQNRKFFSDRRNGETPDKIGGFLGNIFFIAHRWRRGRDSNPRAVSSKLISSQPRYDRFDTSAYKVVFEFCTAFARPMLKCVHSKFKKNEAFARYCEKTRDFAFS